MLSHACSITKILNSKIQDSISRASHNLFCFINYIIKKEIFSIAFKNYNLENDSCLTNISITFSFIIKYIFRGYVFESQMQDIKLYFVFFYI